MMDEPLLSQHELAKAAFGLLTSSSTERYVRIAQDSAAGLVKKLQPVPLRWQRVLDRANRLWQEAVRGTRRESSEVELAVLLSALAQTAIPNVDRLLATVSLIDRPPVAWLSALARNLRMQRRRQNRLHPDVPQTGRKVHRRRRGAARDLGTMTRPRWRATFPISPKISFTSGSPNIIMFRRLPRP